MFLLDTNVVSELRRADRAAWEVRKWADGKDFSDFFISCVTILEMEVGVLRIARRGDDAQARLLRLWVEKTLADFDGRILPIDVTVVMRCASLHVPDPRPDRDAFIAATALVHGHTVVTRNTKDFQPMRVKLLNPWIAA
jgi:toxin FitB